jgi:hypothetical protein
MFEKIIKFLGWGKAPSNYQAPTMPAVRSPKPLPPKGTVVKAEKPKPKRPMPRKKPVVKTPTPTPDV